MEHGSTSPNKMQQFVETQGGSVAPSQAGTVQDLNDGDTNATDYTTWQYLLGVFETQPSSSNLWTVPEVDGAQWCRKTVN